MPIPSVRLLTRTAAALPVTAAFFLLNAVISATNAHAQTPAYSVSQFGSTIQGAASRGVMFQVTQAQRVTALGGGNGDGPVSLFDATTGALLSSSSVQNGSVSGGYKYTNIAPVTLEVGRTYVVSQIYGYPFDTSGFGGSNGPAIPVSLLSDSFSNPLGGITPAPNVTFLRGTSISSLDFRQAPTAASSVFQTTVPANVLLAPTVATTPNTIDFSFAFGAYRSPFTPNPRNLEGATFATSSGNTRTLSLTSGVTVSDVVIGDFGLNVSSLESFFTGNMARSLTYSVGGGPVISTTTNETFRAGRSGGIPFATYFFEVQPTQFVYDLGPTLGTLTVDYQRAEGSRNTGTRSGFAQRPLLANFTYRASSITAAPEPTSLALLALSPLGLIFARRRRA